MRTGVSELVGREEELAAIEAFLDRGRSALLLEGEIGIGKTTLWRNGVERARERSYRVLAATPAAPETQLAYAALRDLLDDVFDEIEADLPAPQRRALAVALLRAAPRGRPPGQEAVAAGFLGALRAAARASPVLVALDDSQWLDPPSALVIAFAARRLRDSPIALLLAVRTGQDVPPLGFELPPELEQLQLGPLSVGALHQLLLGRLAIVLARPTLRAVHELSGGNPFFALEIARALPEDARALGAVPRLPVPSTLRELLDARIAALPPDTQQALAAAAVLGEPVLPAIAAVTGRDAAEALEPAIDDGVALLAEGERVRFAHPLLAAAAYEAVDVRRRRGLHAAAAASAADPEARARHLALAATGRSAAIADALDEAASHARARGSPLAAASLLELASALTPAAAAKAARRRKAEAAYHYFEAGDSRLAQRLLGELVARLPAGPERARALERLARVRSYDEQGGAAGLYVQAISEADGDKMVLARAHAGVAECWCRLRERLADAVEHATLAAGLAHELGDEALVAEALGSKLLAELYLGRESAAGTVRESLEFQSATDDRRVLVQPFLVVWLYSWWTEDFQRARDGLLELFRRAEDLGDESSLPYILVLLGHVELQLGELDSAAARAAAGGELAEQAGQRTFLAYNVATTGLVDAVRGRAQSAREAAHEALELVPETGGRTAERTALAALGHLALSLDDPGETVRRLEPVVAGVRSAGLAEPSTMRFVIDYVEALLALGRIDEATRELDTYESDAVRLSRHAALANTARCRGLLAAVDGDFAGAVDWFERALEEHERVPLPLDRARTLLALGTTRRRAKHKRAARESLEQALAIFEHLGARLWAEKARAELRRIGGRIAHHDELTASERRVAELTAAGKTNREVAAELFVTVHTVEKALTRVYRKLGVRSRAELARLFAESRVSTGKE